MKAQLAPTVKSVLEVKRQNEHQSRILEGQAKMLAGFDAWRRGLWGNGSGVPGFLEVARGEDKAKFSELLSVVTGMREKILREEGKDQLRQEIEENRVRNAQVADEKLTNRLTRAHAWLAIAVVVFSAAGAWVLTLIRPLLKVLIHHLVTWTS